MIRLVCLLLVIPSLLLPPGMCICRIVESGERAWDIEQIAAPEAHACCEHCCHLDRLPVSDTADDPIDDHHSAPGLPAQPDGPCAFMGITAVHPPVPERVTESLVLASLEAVVLVDLANHIWSDGDPGEIDWLPASPIYISHCALLI